MLFVLALPCFSLADVLTPPFHPFTQILAPLCIARTEKTRTGGRSSLLILKK
jgi:hypothetical protein